MSSTPRSLYGYTSGGEPVFGADEPNSRTHTPLPSRSKSTPVNAEELRRALLARRRTETDPRLLSADLLTSDEESSSRYQSSHSIEFLVADNWDHNFDLQSQLEQQWRPSDMVLRSPPLQRRNSLSAEEPRPAGSNLGRLPPHPAQPGQQTQGQSTLRT